jgi:mono/diheme cytochrome c family protein
MSHRVLLLVAVLSSAAAAADHSAGERLYRTHCADCHGASGAGDGADAPLFAKRPRDLRTGFIANYTTSHLAERILDGRALPLAFDLPALKARAKEVESVAVYMARLPDIDWRRASEGEWVYTQRCEICHGLYGEAAGSPPPGVRRPRDLSDPAFQSSISDDDLQIAVGHGRAGMPGLVPRLKDGEVRDVAAYVRLFSPGFKTYTQYCANCHGADGRGVGSFGDAMALPTIAFDRDYFRRANGESLRAQIWHMVDEHAPSMPHFREKLGDEQARQIVEYLRTLESSPTAKPGAAG